MESHTYYMDLALAEARKAASLGEVPIGAVLVIDGEVISSAHNEVESLQDPTAHAELLVIGRAGRSRSNWRLSSASLYVTLEPCPMCLGAMLLARVANLHFACADPRQGAVGSVFDFSNHPDLPHQLSHSSGLREVESQTLLQEFFKGLRGTTA